MRYRVIVGFALIFVGFLLFGLCLPQSKAITLEEDCINIVKLSFFAISDGDFASLADLYSPDYLQHAPEFDDPVTWSEFELSCRIVHSRLPNLRYRIVDIFAFKDKVAVRSVWEYPRDPSWSEWHMVGIDLKGSAISIIRIENGLIIEEWCEYDPSVIKRFCAAYKRLDPTK